MAHPHNHLVILIVSFFVCFSAGEGIAGIESLDFNKRSKINADIPAMIYADDVNYDQSLGVLTAKGHVEVEQEGRILEADQISYHEKTDLVVASGNVRLREPTGDVSFAEYLELKGDLKEGLSQQARLLLSGNERFTAGSLRKKAGGKRTEMENVSYTPCERCKDHPENPPLWSIQAKQIVKDVEAGEMTYVDANLMIAGASVCHLPYLTTSLKRRSGFLMPTAGTSGDLGTFVGVPYYWVLGKTSGDQDLTFTPYVTSKRHIILALDYRKRFQDGKLRLSGSTNFSPESRWVQAQPPAAQKEKIPDIRGHFFAEGEFHLNERWRIKFQEQRLSDKSYSRSRFFLNTQPETAMHTAHPVLESRYVAERFSESDFFSAQAIHYMGLKASDRQRKTPVVLPVIAYDSGLLPLGRQSFISFQGNAMNLYRREGDRSRRILVKGDWFFPYINGVGQVFSFFSSLRGDLYDTDLYQNQTVKHQGVTARIFPQAGIEWRWPFAHQSLPLVVEPIVQLVTSPQGTPSTKIPNEDCRGYQFDETSLLLPNRLPGYDLLDYGSRLSYGGQILYRSRNMGTFLFFMGQSYAFTHPHPEFKGTGIDHHLSDYVGRILWSGFDGMLHINQRFRLDREKLRTRLSESEIIVGPALFNVSINYLLLRPSALIPNLKAVEQISLGLSSQFHKFWTLSTSFSFDKDTAATQWKSLSHGVGVAYQDECLTAKLDLLRTYYRYRDVKPGYTFLFSIVFKNLGGVSYQPSEKTGLHPKKNIFR
ncbi:MAG: LPS-assembly protein LptD [Alphaproteobacteria bacterium]